MWPMENTNLEILKQIEERKRIQKLKNIMRACKDKLYEIAYEEDQKNFNIRRQFFDKSRKISTETNNKKS